MTRRIIHIDEKLCNGCGLCAKACHEGAIAIVDGKAKLLRDDYCDGLGDCLPACPAGAIRFVEREAAAYDEAAVKKHLASKCQACSTESACASRLGNWPVQIKLAPINAPHFDGAHLLIAADCTAFAYPRFHEEFVGGRVVLAGCPKLDGVDYSIKLTEILKNNDIRSITLTRMTVPCCGGLSYATQTAIENSGKQIPLNVITISPDGKITG